MTEVALRGRGDEKFHYFCPLHLSVRAASNGRERTKDEGREKAEEGRRDGKMYQRLDLLHHCVTTVENVETASFACRATLTRDEDGAV
ncbi:unnamed protein product [Pleuronectes platessa]|uniref:Uncharacterized protein n=1 Tax=Pleuronectes platessa TaxID=8262 RepID=A0A9N7UTW0_PLEPL|nr:unnamed protein product [Pleuronectes platessa]